MRDDTITTYDRPIKARLVVQLDNGESWDATAKDLTKFDLVNSLNAYMIFHDHLTRILGDAGLAGDLTKARLNPIRYLVELALRYPDLLNHPETAENDAQVVAIEEALQRQEQEQNAS